MTKPLQFPGETKPIPADTEVEDPAQGRGTSVKDTIEDAALNTGAHGIANIYRHPARWRKIFWLILFLGGLAIMLWQVSLAVIRYLEYPTSTSIEYDSNTRMRFPAVTVCNNNPYMLNKLRNHSVYPYLEDAYSTWTNVWDVENATRSSNIDTTDAPDYSYDFDDDNFDYGDYDSDYTAYDGEENEDFDFVEDFLSLMSVIPRDERKSLGYTAEDMLIDCTWQGKECRGSQFYQFHNYLYGNCYTFNSGRGARMLETSKEGPMQAFRLGLFIGQDEYIPGIADGAGVRVIIHNQNEMPLPDEQGFNVKPGTKTSIGLTQKMIKRLKPPHGKCKNYENYENKENNAYLNDFDKIGYSIGVCKKTCYQRELIKRCGCFDYKTPVESGLRAYNELESDRFTNSCYNDDMGYKACLGNVSLAYVNGELKCNKTCKEKCKEIQYLTSLSSIDWPSVASTDRVLSELADKNEKFWDIITNDSWAANDRKLWVRENFLKLEVYFKTFNFEVVKMQPAYEMFTLISDFGGQVGLWLGLSMIAIFEAVELIADLIVILVRRARNRSKVKAEQQRLDEEDRWAVSSKEPSILKSKC